jgi:hypothetical protein
MCDCVIRNQSILAEIDINNRMRGDELSNLSDHYFPDNLMNNETLEYITKKEGVCTALQS